MSSGYSKESTFRRILDALPAHDAAWLAAYEAVILSTIPAYHLPTRDDYIRAHDREHNPPGMSLRERARAIEADFRRASTATPAASPRLVSAATLLHMGCKPLRWRQILSIIRPL